MSIKRVLVLVLALVMAVSTFAPSVAAIFNPETHHEHLEEKLNDPELVAKYEELKATVEYVAKDIEENHEEYYANGYAYAEENGYIDAAIEAINVAIETIPQIDLEGIEITEELRARLETELDALVPTLEKLLVILESEEISEFDGFVNAALTLEGDLYLHMNNIYAILEQGSIDLNQFILVPAFYEGLRILEEEVIPAVEAAVEAFVQAVVDHVVEKLTPYYEKVVEVIGIARDTYERLVATIVKINLYVENAIDTVVATYNALVAKIVEFNGNVEKAIDALHNIVNTIIEISGYVKDAAVVTVQLFQYVANVLVENRPLIEEVYANVVAIVEYSYNNKEDIYAAAARLSAYVVELVYETNYNALNGDYELKDDSYYVSFGDASYADALAGKLNLGNKHAVATFAGDYAENLAKADLVTVKLDNGSFMSLAEAQVEGKVAEIIRSNSDIMAWYEALDSMIANPDMPDYIREALIESQNKINGVVDINAQVVELDWDKYLDEEGQAALANLLAQVREEAIEHGVSEYYYLDINPIINEILVDNGLGEIFTLSFDPIVIPQADLVVYAVENTLYGYAEFVGNITTVLENANEDATIVLTPVGNPLYGYSFKGVDFSVYADEAEHVVNFLNTHLYAFALTTENVIFVNSEDADDIYEALNVYCDHAHDSCTDTLCDRCGATIEPLGHIFTNYEFVESTSCKEDGKEVAKCDRCGATDTRTVPNTKGPHEWKDATCTSPKRCTVCGLKDGDPTDHVLGDWRITKDPTSNSEGERERKCLHCEYKETEAIPYDSLSTIAIVAIIVVCVAVTGSLSAFVAGRLRKKNKI